MQAVASLQKNSLPTLTPRQKQIAYLVSQGLSNPAIASDVLGRSFFPKARAREVFLTEGGVACQMSTIFNLLGIRSRHQLACLVLENPELLYVSSNPPLCKITWLKQQRLKAALMLSDAIDRTSDYDLKKDLVEILELLQPNENNQFTKPQRRPLRLTVLPLLQAQNKNPQR